MHAGGTSSSHLATQVFRPVRVALQRDHLHATPGERERAGASTRSDLDHEIAGSETRFGDERVGRSQAEGSSARGGAVARPGASA